MNVFDLQQQNLEEISSSIFAAHNVTVEIKKQTNTWLGVVIYCSADGIVSQKKMNEIAEDIAYSVGEKVEIKINEDGLLEILILNRNPVSLSMTEFYEYFKTKHIFYAEDEYGNYFSHSIDELQNTLITGVPSFGKTNMLLGIYESILKSCSPMEVQAYYFDIRKSTACLFSNPILKKDMITSKNQIIDGLKNLELLIDYSNAKERKIDTIIFIDNLTDLFYDGPETKALLNRLLSKGPSARVYFIVSMLTRPAELIKSVSVNIRTKICLGTLNESESRNCLGYKGPENIEIPGEAYLLLHGNSKPIRFRFPLIEENEILDIEFSLNRNNSEKIEDELGRIEAQHNTENDSYGDGNDPLFVDAGFFIIDNNLASIGSLQRKFEMGFNRATRVMSELEKCGVVGPDMGTKPREVLMSRSQFIKALGRTEKETLQEEREMYDETPRTFLGIQTIENRQRSIFYDSNMPVVKKKKYVVDWKKTSEYVTFSGEYKKDEKELFFYSFDTLSDRIVARKIVGLLNSELKEHHLLNMFFFPDMKIDYSRKTGRKLINPPTSRIEYVPEKNEFLMILMTKDEIDNALIVFSEEGIIKRAKIERKRRNGMAVSNFKNYTTGFALYQARYNGVIYYDRGKDS